MKRINGNYKHDILRVSTRRNQIFNRKQLALLTRKVYVYDKMYGAVITTSNIKGSNIINVSEDDFNKFAENDIIETSDTGISFLWEYENDDNCFFLTESCSCNCIMCPQPPKPHNKEHLIRAQKVLSLIPSKYDKSICVTGGEPTLLGDDYLTFMANIRNKFKNNFLITLTNGKSFSNLEFLNKFHRLQLNSVLAISFCADVDIVHDDIVRTKGSFHKTEEGIYNLAKANEALELRVVVSKLNYQRLPQIAEYIYRNFPFVYHVAFMGLEYTGYADKNYEMIAINPIEYKRELKEAVQILDRFGINVSVYNIPLCLLDKHLHKFAEQSISLWKNDYNDICKDCNLKNKCCGVFTTSDKHPYLNINPIKTESN